METLVIDDGGVDWPAEPATITRRFGRGRNHCSFATEAIALGYVCVDLCRCGTRVALLPHFTTRRAISRLAVVLAGYRAERIALSTDAAMSRWDLIHGVGPAIQ